MFCSVPEKSTYSSLENALIREKVKESLEAYMQPVDIIALPERPFFHFKTNRIGLTRDIEAGKFNK